MLKKYLIGSASAAAILAIMPGHAQAQSVNSRIQALQAQIQQQQQQLQQQQQMLTSLMASEQQTKASVAQVQAVKTAKPSAVAVMSRTNRPGWRSADGQNEIDLGALLQIDGGVAKYKASSPTAAFQKLQSGINARRAQIQVSGTFANDWHFNLQYDMGGSNELFGGSAGGVSSGFKQALLTYDGIKPYGTVLSLEFGYETPPILLDEVIPSNAGLFIEHPTPDRLASGVSGGPGRGVLGFRDYTPRWFTFFAFSGPKAGDVHDQTEPTMPIVAEGRGSFNIINDKSTKLQLGGGFQRIIQPTKYSLADEAEDRVDPTTFINFAPAGTISGGGTFSAELAGEWGPIFAGGSYIHYDAERKGGLKEADAWGAYGEVMYSITGEQHPYLASSGGWGNPSPAHPFSLKTGGMGAWEVGIRYSYANLNSDIGSPLVGGVAQAVNGGRFHDLALGVNWYVNDNIRFQLDWMHGFLGGIIGNGGFATNQEGTKQTMSNGHWDQIAIRSQFSF